ncbi:hypothetical protein Tco_0436108 [Tanacetum coccineum]
MVNLKFADTHNMVAFLSKPAESEGFEQIVDFLNAHTIKDLQLEDVEGVDCLPNATIFEQLTLMGSKTTAWNEFSSTMASVIICLATNQKFNFSKYIFESMVKNLDNVSRKFLMYPRFVQMFVNQKLEGMPTHKRIYIAPSHTKKIFGNMRRVGKGFSGRETPLFQTMMVQDQEEMGKGSEMPTDPHHTHTIIQPSTSQPQKKQRSRRSKRKDTEMDDSLERDANTATGLEVKQDSGNIDKTQSKATLNEPSSSGTSSGSGPRRQETIGDTIAQTRDRLKLKELMALCTTLQSRVLALETTKTTQATEIASLKKRVNKLERRNKSRTHGLKRLYRVGSSRKVESYEDEGLGEEDASKQRRIANIDANKDIYLVNVQTDEDMFGVNDLDGDEAKIDADYQLAQRLQAQEQDEFTNAEKVRLFVQFLEQRRKQFTAKRAEEKRNRPPTRAQQRSIMCTYLNNMEGWKPKSMKNNSLKRAREELEQESSKKQKLEEDKESEELKQCLEIFPDDGDDVTIDATPLSTKSPTIVDYKIYKEGKKSYF